MSEYEIMVKEFVPALRAKAAKIMDKKGMKQQKIARLLDITQAAISKYLAGKYSDEVRRMESTLKDKEIEAFIDSMVKGDVYEKQKHVCKMCSRNLSFRCGLMVK